MASGTVQSVLGKISQGHLECSICLHRFREPKLLDCFHSFCLKCLEDLKEHHHPQGEKIWCPVCRRETILKEHQVANLPNNFTLGALVEEFDIQEQLLEGKGSKIKCQACDDGNQATSRCMDCYHFLCQECQKQHKRMSIMKSHKIFTLAQLRSGEVIFKSKLREYIPKCGKHTDQNLSIYCNTCEQLVCAVCSTLEHGNPQHSLTGLPEALGKCKHAVAEMAKRAEKTKTELNTVIQTTEKIRQKLDTMYTDTNLKISKKADMEVAKIKAQVSAISLEEQKLKNIVQEVYKHRVKTLESAHDINTRNVTQTEQTLDDINQFMQQGSCYEILEFKQKSLHILEELTKNEPERVPENVSFMDYEEGEKLLGKLVLEERLKLNEQVETERLLRWELKTLITTFGQNQTELRNVNRIAAFSNNEIVALDQVHKQVITFLDIPHSNVLSQELQLIGLTKPSHISVNKDGEIIILDSPAVKIFNRGYQACLHQFLPGTGPQSKPTCLAVDDNNKIAVGYEDEEKVSLHNQDGSLIKTLPAPMISANMIIYKHQLIYTNGQQRKLLSVDYNGTIIFAVNALSIPTGLCCDESGAIYITVFGQVCRGAIHLFSPQGKYTGCTIEGSGYPGGITFTPEGNLAVAAKDSVKLYHLVEDSDY